MFSNLSKYKRLVKKINEIDYSKKRDTQLYYYFSRGKNMVILLAILKEIIRRALHITVHDEQLIGTLALLNNQAAEMKTGEGKTLSIAMAAAIKSKYSQVYVVTVNSYLSARDVKNLAPFYEFLRLTPGNIDFDKNGYNENIVYGTNSTFAFDYLKDGLRMDGHKMQKRFDSVIIDEIDAVLIEDAHSSISISDFDTEKNIENLFLAEKITSDLKLGQKIITVEIFGNKEYDEGDYIINHSNQIVYLTEVGIKKIEDQIESNIFENADLYFKILQSLRVKHFLKRDVDYKIENGTVIIINKFTGRMIQNYTLLNGLHQAIEVKEGITITHERVKKSETSFQNYFRKFNSISGLSGTLMTEKTELWDVYKLKTIEIPTNRLIIRVDHKDKLFISSTEMDLNLVNTVQEYHKTGAPILIGTKSVLETNHVLELIKHLNPVALNADNEADENEIIANAGLTNTITIASNIIGRGVDIVTAHEKGLIVIGYGRSRNRRIDNQLIGRSGRQGYAGESIFFISLQDSLLTNFAENKLALIAEKLKLSQHEMFESKAISLIIKKAQNQNDAIDFKRRQELVNYDDILTAQRVKIQEIREAVFLIDDIDKVLNKIKELIVSQDENLDIAYPTIVYNFRSVSSLQVIEIFKTIYLNEIDYSWSRYLQEIDYLKSGIHLQSLTGKNPIIEYQKRSYYLFKELLDIIRYNLYNKLLNVEIGN